MIGSITVAAALKMSFGTDGQPGSCTDVDHADTFALFGHNVAETQSVLLNRMLDRRRGANPLGLLVVDPRRTCPAREADLQVALRPGTNLALMNNFAPRDHRQRLGRRRLHRCPYAGSAGDAIYMFGGGLIAITITGWLAHHFKHPLLFPSLGPTAILFLETPMAANATPRNTLVGHAVAIAAGLLSLVLFDLRGSPSVLEQCVTNERIAAAALAVALTGAVLL